jgi:hypothetical protein
LCPSALRRRISRNAFTGPYETTDLRLTKKIRVTERYKLNLMAGSFNLFNRDNQRVAITSNGLVATSSTFVQSSVTNGLATDPGYYQLPGNFMKPKCRLRTTAGSAVAEVCVLSFWKCPQQKKQGHSGCPWPFFLWRGQAIGL